MSVCVFSMVCSGRGAAVLPVCVIAVSPAVKRRSALLSTVTRSAEIHYTPTLHVKDSYLTSRLTEKITKEKLHAGQLTSIFYNLIESHFDSCGLCFFSLKVIVRIFHHL